MSQTEQYDFDVSKALRDALSGVSRADWIVPIEQADQARQEGAMRAQAMQAAQALQKGAATVEQMGTAVETAGNAAQAIQGARAA